MTHQEYQELLAANALNALDTADERALRSHLETCADCRSELGEWEQTAAFIALDARPLEPSAALYERILANVREESTTSPEQVGVQPKPNLVPFVHPTRSVWSSFGSLGAIAALIIFAALLISVFALWRQNRSYQQELARLSAELKQAQARIDHEREVVALLTSPDAQMAKLAGTKMAPSAHAMLAYNKEGKAMFMAQGLPAAPAGMAYQLWFIKDNKKMPGKVFTTDLAGNAAMEDQVPQEARQSAVFAITLEPKDGVAVPTGSVYLVSTT